MTDIKKYLTEAVEASASDLFVVAGAPVAVKIGGVLEYIGEEKLFPPDTDGLISELYKLAERSDERLRKVGDDDFSFAVSGLARFRVSAYKQRGSLAAVIRIVAFNIPSYRELFIPEEIMSLSEVRHGLILFTGIAGSGKSTTQACLIDRINHTRNCHIITLEDPIEFLHKNDKSIVSQREIAIDTENCISALRACLRQAPDVILLGEMRDADTIRTAMTAAETGHTVIATLHTQGTANSIDRIIDAFPAEQQAQIRIQLASVLHTVISQQLVRSTDGKLIPCFEIMHTNSAVKSLIRDGRTHQLSGSIATFREEGMITMDQSLCEMLARGLIDRETAFDRAEDAELMKRRLRK
ncbi:MAG: PilT/PilU family type 4a pilus ATPase [Ruminococcaceae bacterium]|nr:PilT/PilU family type 4a pilus ATPase [Oscillospiraceae bacterium]